MEIEMEWWRWWQELNIQWEISKNDVSHEKKQEECQYEGSAKLLLSKVKGLVIKSTAS